MRTRMSHKYQRPQRRKRLAPFDRVMVLRISGFCGVAGPLIALSLILVAVSRSPWFSWTGSYLSDLGDPRTHPNVAVLFNSGLIIGGALTAIFGIGLKRALPGLTRSGLGAIAIVLGSAALCCVGIFTERTLVVHCSVTLLFYILSIIALVLIGSAMMQEPAVRNLGLFIFTAGLFICLPAIALVVIILIDIEVRHAGGAIPEFIGALGVSVCFLILAVRLLRQAPRQARD
jgi:hypothetical membrane protein